MKEQWTGDWCFELNQWKDRWWWLVWRTTPVPRHIEPPLPRRLPYALFHSACSSFLSAWARSIHHLIDSVLLLSPFKSDQVRKVVDFFSCAIHSMQLAPIPPFPPLYWFSLMRHGKGVSQMYSVFCFVYILFDVLTLKNNEVTFWCKDFILNVRFWERGQLWFFQLAFS